MTKSVLNDMCNGQHFNHSLWSKNSKENAMFDVKQPDKLSAVAKQWIAGLLHHADSLTALCCPTVNCYRRLHTPFAPDKADWGIDNRKTAFRVKTMSASETYVENRIPSGSANPYILLAATVAAGISGIKNKMECPPERQENERSLPMSLEDALVALEKDEVMVKALGEQFVKWFVKIKRELEINVLRGKGFEEELNLYFKML